MFVARAEKRLFDPKRRFRVGAIDALLKLQAIYDFTFYLKSMPPAEVVMTDKIVAIQQVTDLGYGVIALMENEKSPVEKGWQRKASRDPRQLHEWFVQKNYNVGLPTGSTNALVVLDFDNLEEGRSFFKKHRDIIRTIVSTPHEGVHFFLQDPDFEVRNASDRTRNIDRRGEGGLVAIPPSQINGTPYKFLKGYELVPANELQIYKREYWPLANPESAPNAVNVQITGQELVRLRKRVLSYVLKIRAVSGDRGHDATFRVCCKLREFGVRPEEAWLILNEWNRTNAAPPWSVEELWHKHEDVFYRQTNNQ